MCMCRLVFVCYCKLSRLTENNMVAKSHEAMVYYDAFHWQTERSRRALKCTVCLVKLKKSILRGREAYKNIDILIILSFLVSRLPTVIAKNDSIVG